MKLKDISKEELETMNYDDIAFIILNDEKEKMKINVLFKKVCDALGLSEKEFEDKIADFFELLTTDKRFIMLEDGSWDLKEKYNTKVVIEDEDDEAIAPDEEEENLETDENESEEDIFYDADGDDDIVDDELDDLVVIDVDEEEANN